MMTSVDQRRGRRPIEGRRRARVRGLPSAGAAHRGPRWGRLSRPDARARHARAARPACRGWRHHHLRDQQLTLASHASIEARLRLDGRAGAPDRIVPRRARRRSALAEHARQPPHHVMVFGGPGLGRELRDVGLRDGRTDRPRPGHRARRGRRRDRLRPHDGAPVDRRRRHPRRSAVRRHEPRSGLSRSTAGCRRRGRGRRCPRDGIGPRAGPRHRQAGARPVPPGGAGRRARRPTTRSSSATACARTSWPRTVSAPDPC